LLSEKLPGAMPASASALCFGGRIDPQGFLNWKRIGPQRNSRRDWSSPGNYKQLPGTLRKTKGKGVFPFP
jgi:hypothetical protein